MKVGLKSKATDSKEKFRSQDIKRLYVIFTPGRMIREGLLSTALHSIAKDEENQTCTTTEAKNKEEESQGGENSSTSSEKGSKQEDPNKDYTGNVELGMVN